MLLSSEVYGLLEFALLTLTFLFVYLKSTKQKKKRLEPVVVPFAWPLLGHLPQMALDPHGFILRTYQKYGKVFTVRCGLKKITYVCDRDLLREYMLADEDQLSFYKFVHDTYVSKCFSDTLNNAIAIVKPFIKSFLTKRMSEFIGIINDDLELYMEKFKQKCLEEASGGPVLIEADELLEQVCHKAVFKSTFSFELSPEIKAIHANFSFELQKAVLATYFLPRKVVDRFLLPKIQRIRNDHIAIFKPILMKYINDSTDSSSKIMRMAADFDFKPDGRASSTPDEICQVMLAMHFTLMTTPLSLCSHAVKELATRPDLWNQIRSELNPSNTSTESILKNTTLHACVMEAARVNSHLVVLQRATHPTSYVGPYYVGNSDTVTVPGALLFEFGPAEVNYLDPGKYLPERFMRGPESESLQIRSFWLWGGGPHACPGRNISIAIAKLFLLQLIHRFDVELKSKSERGYINLSTLASQTVNLCLTPLLNK